MVVGLGWGGGKGGGVLLKCSGQVFFSVSGGFAFFYKFKVRGICTWK